MRIAPNPDLERETLLKYIRFEHDKSKGRMVLHYIIFALGFFIFSMGVYVSTPPLWLTGLGLLIYPVFLVLRFQIQKKLYLKQLDKLLNFGESRKRNPLHFSFDESTFTTADNDYKLDTNWSAVKRFDENEGDLYLFSIQDELMTIISEQKIGSENYSTFRDHLINR